MSDSSKGEFGVICLAKILKSQGLGYLCYAVRAIDTHARSGACAFEGAQASQVVSKLSLAVWQAAVMVGAVPGARIAWSYVAVIMLARIAVFGTHVCVAVLHRVLLLSRPDASC